MASKVKENEEADSERDGATDGPLLDLSDDAVKKMIKAAKKRFHKSSMRVGENYRLKGREICAELGLDPIDYASHGGSFPVRVAGTGVVAAITVSGLASEDDHGLIIRVLEDYLAEEQ